MCVCKLNPYEHIWLTKTKIRSCQKVIVNKMKDFCVFMDLWKFPFQQIAHSKEKIYALE